MTSEILLFGERTLGHRNVVECELKAGEVRVGAIRSGISSGTELRHYRAPARDDGMRPGYELVGRVLEAEDPADDDLVGALVWLDHPHAERATVSAGEARLGLLADGPGLLDRFAFLARTRTALNAVHDAEIRLGDRVVVIGLGVLGLLATRLAVLSGAGQVAAVDPVVERRRVAELWGADPLPPGDAPSVLADVVIDASGRPESLADAAALCAERGRIVVLSTYSEGSVMPVPSRPWSTRQQTLSFTTTRPGAHLRGEPLWNHQRQLETARTLLGSGAVVAEELATVSIDFEDAETAFQLLDEADPPPLSVLLTYGAEATA
jgi:2-desacetyl-2-hydroxyethyl bacteriochlorophyllide A dehydrogenase